MFQFFKNMLCGKCTRAKPKPSSAASGEVNNNKPLSLDSKNKNNNDSDNGNTTAAGGMPPKKTTDSKTAPKSCDEQKQTALHRACAKGEYKKIENLLETGANVDTIDSEGNTPLHIASRNIDRPIVQLLIQYGANSLAKNNLGKIPLNLWTDSSLLAPKPIANSTTAADAIVSPLKMDMALRLHAANPGKNYIFYHSNGDISCYATKEELDAAPSLFQSTKAPEKSAMLVFR